MCFFYTKHRSVDTNNLVMACSKDSIVLIIRFHIRSGRPFCKVAFRVFSPAKVLVNFLEKQVHILINQKKKHFEVILLKLSMILAFNDWTVQPYILLNVKLGFTPSVG